MEKNSRFRANRIFVDRIEPTAIVNNTCTQMLQGQLNKKVFVFYGYGGIGKSKFLDELQKNVIYLDEFDIIKINLNIYEYNNVISILLAIRRSLNIDCTEFDYATIQYYNKCRLPFSQLAEQLKTAKSTMFSFIKDSAKNCGDIFIPGFSYFEKIAGLFPKFKELFSRLKNEKKYKYMDDIDANTLLKQLPTYLANGINEYKKKIILVFDDYESMKNKLNGGSLSNSCDEWVFNFLKNINKGIFIISSREKMNWSQNKISDTPIEQYYLERLSEKDSRLFLSSVPIENEEYVNAIINVAQGVPIYLDMCVDLYENHIKQGSSTFNLGDVDTESIINRYLAHLSMAQGELVHVLANIEVFDFDFLKFIIRELNFAIDELELKDLLDKCIFEKLDSEDYKLDASIQKQLLILQESRIANSCLAILLKYLANNSAVCLNNLLSYFESACKLLNKVKCDKKEKEMLFVCINHVLNAGYWTSADALARTYLDNEEYGHFATYIQAQKEKREGNLVDALNLAETLIQKMKEFGAYKFSVQLLKTQIVHLLGNYDDAVKGYNDVVNKMELFDLEQKDEETYILAKLKLADINFLKGNFIEAKKSLKSLRINDNKNLEIECLRIKAHIHRFNLDFENARDLYESGLEQSETDKKARAMLLNNLAEIYCVRQPDLAIEYGKKSLEENGLLSANIEIGKSYAALSIAYARKYDFENALHYAEKSVALQSKIGYKSGELFGYFALCYLDYCKGNREGYEQNLKKMKEIYAQIKTYPYVVKFAEYLSTEKWCEDDISWLEDCEMEERVKILLKNY